MFKALIDLFLFVFFWEYNQVVDIIKRDLRNQIHSKHLFSYNFSYVSRLCTAELPSQTFHINADTKFSLIPIFLYRSASGFLRRTFALNSQPIGKMHKSPKLFNNARIMRTFSANLLNLWRKLGSERIPDAVVSWFVLPPCVYLQSAPALRLLTLPVSQLVNLPLTEANRFFSEITDLQACRSISDAQVFTAECRNVKVKVSEDSFFSLKIKLNYSFCWIQQLLGFSLFYFLSHLPFVFQIWCIWILCHWSNMYNSIKKEKKKNKWGREGKKAMISAIFSRMQLFFTVYPKTWY